MIGHFFLKQSLRFCLTSCTVGDASVPSEHEKEGAGRGVGSSSGPVVRKVKPHNEHVVGAFLARVQAHRMKLRLGFFAAVQGTNPTRRLPRATFERHRQRIGPKVMDCWK